MPFTSENQPATANRWAKGESGNPNGRPAGAKTRSTVAKKILEMTAIMPDAVYEKIKEVYPDAVKTMTAEEIATLVLISNAIAKGDVNAYKSVMDSAYGAPKQEVDSNVNLKGSITPDKWLAENNTKESE